MTNMTFAEFAKSEQSRLLKIAAVHGINIVDHHPMTDEERVDVRAKTEEIGEVLDQLDYLLEDLFMMTKDYTSPEHFAACDFAMKLGDKVEVMRSEAQSVLYDLKPKITNRKLTKAITLNVARLLPVYQERGSVMVRELIGKYAPSQRAIDIRHDQRARFLTELRALGETGDTEWREFGPNDPGAALGDILGAAIRRRNAEQAA